MNGVWTGDVVARLRPTLTRLVEGVVEGDRITVEAMEDAATPYEFGFPEDGWYTVGRPVRDENFVVRAHWVFPVTGTRPLPRHLRLSGYDIGHQVVVTRGEFLGAQGTVTSLLGPPRPAVLLAGGAAHVIDAVGALFPDGADPADLAPLAVRCPPGAPVWVWRPLPLVWGRGVVTAQTPRRTKVWVLEEETEWVYQPDRLLIHPRHDDVAPPWIVPTGRHTRRP